MECKYYKYDQYSVIKDDLLYSLNINDYQKSSPEQINLFTLMINSGYTPIISEQISFSDEQIVNFWNYAKDSFLTSMQINQYYSLLALAPILTSRIPTLKMTGAFYSPDVVFSVLWKTQQSSGMIKSVSPRYLLKGLELFSSDDELKGSLAPEYFNLYKLVDKANKNWHKMTKSEKYNYLVELRTISENTRFEMPSELISTLTDMQQS